MGSGVVVQVCCLPLDNAETQTIIAPDRREACSGAALSRRDPRYVAPQQSVRAN